MCAGKGVCSVLLLQARITGQYYSEQLEVTFWTTLIIVISKNVKRNSHTETDLTCLLFQTQLNVKLHLNIL